MTAQAKLISSQPAPKPGHVFDVFVFVRQPGSLGVIHNGEIIKGSEAVNRIAALIEAHILRTSGARPMPVGTVIVPPDQIETISRIGQEQAAADQEGQG